jgi:hypothetical protein
MSEGLWLQGNHNPSLIEPTEVLPAAPGRPSLTEPDGHVVLDADHGRLDILQFVAPELGYDELRSAAVEDGGGRSAGGSDRLEETA